MGIRREIEKRIEKKQKEMQDLERETTICLREGAAYIQGLQESLRLMPKEAIAGEERTLRAGSLIAKARDAIELAGKSLHISELLKALGRPVDHANKVSLSGSLAAYVRKGDVFTRPAPNTFGLVSFEPRKRIEPNNDDDELPESFGLENGKQESDKDVPF